MLYKPINLDEILVKREKDGKQSPQVKNSQFG